MSRRGHVVRGNSGHHPGSIPPECHQVDECHRMQPGGVLYRQVQRLSKKSPHVLLLSATPGRQHADAYLALLHERPATLARCVRVFRASERVARWITASPQLLDDLLAPDRNPDLPRLPTLQPGDVEHNLKMDPPLEQRVALKVRLEPFDLGSTDADKRNLVARLAATFAFSAIRLPASLLSAFLSPSSPPRSSIRSGDVVEMPSRTFPSTSSTRCPWMCFSDRCTTSRGRSAVPTTFVRTR